MALEQKLSLKLSQRLVMTPSLQQAIKLLQMTRLELEGALTQELVENPVLEEREEFEDEKSSDDEEDAERTAEDELLDAMSDIDLDSYFRDYWEQSSSGSSYEERDGMPLENRVSRQPDLYDHLLWQLHMTDVGDEIRMLGELIIGNLDTDGFLAADLEEIREMTRDNGSEPLSIERVEAALEFVQSLDPAGVACRDLRESLLRQLEAANFADSIAYTVVRDHWDLFLRRQFQPLARQLEMPLADLEPVVEQIKNLETHPGRRFSTDRTHYVEPDVAIVKVGEKYVIQLNDDGLPRLRISKKYRQLLQSWRKDKREAEAQQYVREKLRSALWLIKSLDQRQRTIYKVADSIIRQQREFLDNGLEYLRPMVLRDVAEDIGMHESTVSRVVSNKYMHTPRGLFPMKFFFHSGIDREYGGNISSLTVKRKIENLIEAEDPKRPISDSGLTRMLKREGIQIARRTVAKYRDELGIPSSTDRKQIF